MEVIIAAMLLALAVGGVVNIFVSGRRFIQHSRMRMTGGEIGKTFIDPLQADVRQDTWGTAGNNLNETGAAGRITNGSIDGINYQANYVIANVAITPGNSINDIRRVQTTLSWTEQ